MQVAEGVASFAGEAPAATPEAVTTTIPRADAKTALSAEEPAVLTLDVAHGDGAGQVMVQWPDGELEKLLAATSGHEITLVFSREQLQQALEQDVEAHGLKERVLVLSVAAATAVGAAGAASAGVLVDGGAPVAGEQAAAVVNTTYDVGGMLVDSQTESAAATSYDVGGTLVTPSDDVTTQQPAVSNPTYDVGGTLVDSRSESTAATTYDVGGVQVEPGTSPAPAQPAADAASSGLSAGEDAAIAAGAALLITAAGFGVARMQRRRPEPGIEPA